jgi:hypothetical protein
VPQLLGREPTPATFKLESPSTKQFATVFLQNFKEDAANFASPSLVGADAAREGMPNRVGRC